MLYHKLILQNEINNYVPNGFFISESHLKIRRGIILNGVKPIDQSTLLKSFIDRSCRMG